MGIEILVFALAIVVTLLVLVGFVAFWVSGHADQEDLGRFFVSYARARGLMCSGLRGEWPNRSWPVLSWSDEHARYRLALRPGEQPSATFVEVWPHDAILGRAEGVFGASLRATEELPQGLLSSVFSPEVLHLCACFRQGDTLSLRIDRGKAQLEWPGAERNDARLDEARALATALAASMRQRFLNGRAA